MYTYEVSFSYSFAGYFSWDYQSWSAVCPSWTLPSWEGKNLGLSVIIYWLIDFIFTITASKRSYTSKTNGSKSYAFIESLREKNRFPQTAASHRYPKHSTKNQFILSSNTAAAALIHTTASRKSHSSRLQGVYLQQNSSSPPPRSPQSPQVVSFGAKYLDSSPSHRHAAAHALPPKEESAFFRDCAAPIESYRCRKKEKACI